MIATETNISISVKPAERTFKTRLTSLSSGDLLITDNIFSSYDHVDVMPTNAKRAVNLLFLLSLATFSNC